MGMKNKVRVWWRNTFPFHHFHQQNSVGIISKEAISSDFSRFSFCLKEDSRRPFVLTSLLSFFPRNRKPSVSHKEPITSWLKALIKFILPFLPDLLFAPNTLRSRFFNFFPRSRISNFTKSGNLIFLDFNYIF